MSIIELAHQYNQFQSDFGAGVPLDFNSFIEGAFSVDFQKIANGQSLVSMRNELHNQLIQVKDIAGRWTIESIKIIPSADNKECTIRYFVDTEKLGKFDVLAVLSSSNGRYIDQINEIYYQI
jgi:hypothetical protein